jgi:hypothetical protein
LRQRIILCRIIDPEHGQQVIAQAPASVQDFLRMDEDYVMLEQAQQAGHGDISRIIALASDIQRRERLIALAFEGEQLLEQEGLASVRPEERTEPLERLVRVYVQELTKELHREQLQSLERQMVAARAAGDTARETELRQTFAQLLQGK